MSRPARKETTMYIHSIRLDYHEPGGNWHVWTNGETPNMIGFINTEHDDADDTKPLTFSAFVADIDDAPPIGSFPDIVAAANAIYAVNLMLYE
jgi:hypothetical protein